MFMSDVFDKVTVEHEGALEDTNHHQFKMNIFALDLVVVLIDLFG